MNFAQLHEALRLEILRRVRRGTLTGTLLARQTGLAQAHISNFLRQRRFLSLDAMDKVLAALGMTVADLMPADMASTKLRRTSPSEPQYDVVPLVSQASAIHDPHIPPHEVILELRLPPGTLDHVRKSKSKIRERWQRFVAVRITGLQAEPMKPLLSPNMVLLIDRHHTSLGAYLSGMPTLYAIASGNSLMIRYVSLNANRLILRPYNIWHTVELIDLAPGQSASDFLVGRICFFQGQI